MCYSIGVVKKEVKEVNKMNNQTESYIVLKPIAERFSKVANEISDEEIKTMIKSVMQDRIANAIDEIA